MSLPLPLEELQDGPSFFSFDTVIIPCSELVPSLSCCGSCICPVEDVTKLYLNALETGSPAQQEEYQGVSYQVQNTSLCLLITHVMLHHQQNGANIYCAEFLFLCVF